MKQIINNKVFSWIFKIVLTLLFVYIVNRSLTRSELQVIARYLTVPHILAAMLLSIIGLYFQVKRWEIILRFQKFSVENYVAWKTLLWGNLLAFVTPGRFGEIFRGIRIAENRKGDSLFAVIIDKLFIILTVLLAGLISIGFQVWILNIGITYKIKIFLVAAFVLCIIGFLLLSTGKVFDKKHTVTQYFDRVLKNLPRLFTFAGRKALIYSFIAHFCLICQSVVLLRMFGCGTVILNSTAVAQAYGIMPFLSFTIGNMGVREGSFNFFLSQLGAVCESNELTVVGATLGVSMIILIMNLVLPAFIGLLWYLYDTTFNK